MIYFADTFYFLSRLNPQDRAHARAMTYPASRRDFLVTTEWVIMELADGLCDARNRRGFAAFYRRLNRSRDIEIVEADHRLFEAGMSLYENRLDKDWSLTDCTSFIVMQDRNITDALTADHHFEQAGFNALLK
jgi:predicted nucleic acid-binding protein